MSTTLQHTIHCSCHTFRICSSYYVNIYTKRYSTHLFHRNNEAYINTESLAYGISPHCWLTELISTSTLLVLIELFQLKNCEASAEVVSSCVYPLIHRCPLQRIVPLKCKPILQIAHNTNLPQNQTLCLHGKLLHF